MKRANVAAAPAGPVVAGAVDVVLAYKKVFSTQEGAIVIADLMRHFGYTMNSTFDPAAPHTQPFKEGQRVVLIHIGRRIDADPASLEATEKTEL